MNEARKTLTSRKQKAFMKRSKKTRSDAIVIEPVQRGVCQFHWNGLEAKRSRERGAGLGLFATGKLRAGTVIPMLGKKTNIRTGTHLFNGRNGFPGLHPFQHVGYFGLSIAMMANEPARRKPNCILKKIGLVVARDIAAGAELLVYYGDSYRRGGYTISENKHLDTEFTALEKVRLPTQKQMEEVVRKWDNTLSACEELEKSGALQRLRDAGA